MTDTKQAATPPRETFPIAVGEGAEDLLQRMVIATHVTADSAPAAAPPIADSVEEG